MLIDELDGVSNSILAAWLPGTSGGQGIVDGISGTYSLKPNGSGANTLSMDWPRDMVLNDLYRPLFQTSLSMAQMKKYLRSLIPYFQQVMGFQLRVVISLINDLNQPLN